MTCPYIIYGSQSVYCGYCHKSPRECRCEDFGDFMADINARLAARRDVVAAANAHQATCPTCGAPMPGGVPAADPPTMPAPAPDANIANEPTPSGYMSRPKMI